MFNRSARRALSVCRLKPISHSIHGIVSEMFLPMMTANTAIRHGFLQSDAPSFGSCYAPFNFDATERCIPRPDRQSDGLTPHVQVSDDGTLLLDFELPGFKAAEVNVLGDAAKDCLTVVAERMDGARLRPGQPRKVSQHYRVPSQSFDLSKVGSKVEDGVLTVTVPPRVVPEEDKGPLESMRWPPQLTIDETPEGVVHCRFTLPREIAKENISVQLQGRSLLLRMKASLHSGESLSRTLSYIQTLTVPKGTTAAQVRTVFEPGCFTVIIEKAPERHTKAEDIPVN